MSIETLSPPSKELSSSPEYKVSPITPEMQQKRGWSVEINGVEMKEPITDLKIKNNKMGVELDYGQKMEGYDGVILKEPGGGGSVTIPYFVRNGELYIGVVEESRPTCTDGKPDKIYNVPRGFLDPNEKHFAAAMRELQEETGYKPMSDRVKPLSGDPMNPNSAFFVTGKDKGVHMYGVNVMDTEVKQMKDGMRPQDSEFTFNEEVIQPTSKLGEKIAGSKFIHWSKAVQLVDMFSVAGVARLLHESQAGGPQIEQPQQQHSEARKLPPKWLPRRRAK